tara:strand:+ start:217 stop:630 length:414 start_codon:yes stop_codon:yes gene_type:complete
MDKVKMTGRLVPFQIKGGGSYTDEFPVRQDQNGNRYLGGISVILDFGVEGQNVSRGATIELSKNSQYETIRDKMKSFFVDKDTEKIWNLDDTNSIKVMFDFAGCVDSYTAPEYDGAGNVVKQGQNYYNVKLENLELV